MKPILYQIKNEKEIDLNQEQKKNSLYNDFASYIYGNKTYEKVENLEDFMILVFCQKRFHHLYYYLQKDIPNNNKSSQTSKETENFKFDLTIISLTGDNDKEKVLIFFLLTMINQFFYENVIKNENLYDFVFDFPLDVIFMASISDITPAIFSVMNIMDDKEYERLYKNFEAKRKEKKDLSYEYFENYSKKVKNINKNLFTFEEKNGFIKYNGIIEKEKIKMEDLIRDYLKFHIPIWAKSFKELIDTLNYRDLVEIAYSSTPDEDDYLIYDTFIKKFIDDDSFRSAGIHDMINFTNELLNDYKRLSPESNSEEGKFFENAFHKLSDYFKQIQRKSYTPFLSSTIYEAVYKLKKVISKGKIKDDIKSTMNSILRNTNEIKMSSDQQKESLPYYFLDLSGAPLHKLMELNPKALISFTLSPYVLKKDLPNIELLIQDHDKIQKKCKDKFDSKIFSCSPTALSTIAVVRDIFVEYDLVTERLTDKNDIKPNIYQEKLTSPLPGMLIFKLSMLQWDFMPNFAQDLSFVPVFQVPYNSINKYAIKDIKVKKGKKKDEKDKKFFLDLHTADCNLCFYPLTESEANAIGTFFKEQIRIEEYKHDILKRHFLDKTKSEMMQAGLNYIPNMIVDINEKKEWPLHPLDKNDPSKLITTDLDEKNPNPYYVMFKDFGNVNGNDAIEKLSKTIHYLCDSKSTVLLLESVCYLCQKEPVCASAVLKLLEKELKSADNAKKKRMLTIIDRFIDPAILQNQKNLLDDARDLTEMLHFQFSKNSNDTIDPDELTKRVVSISQGTHFFSLSSEERNKKLGFDKVHREWLMNSIPNSNENDDEKQSLI